MTDDKTVKDDAVARAKAGEAIAPTTAQPRQPVRAHRRDVVHGPLEARQDLVDRIMNDPRMHDHKDGLPELHPVRHLHVGLPGGALHRLHAP